MNKQKFQKDLDSVYKNIQKELSAQAGGSQQVGSGPNYRGALAYEGYDAGYAQAISDVLLFSNDVRPNRHERWWKEVKGVAY